MLSRQGARQGDCAFYFGADTDTQGTQTDTVGCCGLAAEKQDFSRMRSPPAWHPESDPSSRLAAMEKTIEQQS